MVNFGSEKEFIANYQKLKSSRKMAELYGCSKTTILNYAKKINYDTSENKERKITLIPIEIIIKDYEELKNCKKVGEKYNCSSTAVREYLLKNNYQIQNHQSKLSNISPQNFIKDYNELKSAEKMSQKYNCSSTAILNYAKKINYNTSKKYKLSEEDKKYIIENYNNYTSNELAEKFKVSRGIITKLWHDNNLVGKKIIMKNNYIDLTNQQFGFWTVLKKSDKRDSGGNIYWICKCKCGIEKEVSGASLRNGTSLSCGSHSNVSKGNEKIKTLLLNAKIPFEIEKSFDTCKDKKSLPFDFYVDNKYLIEYDGVQHFQESIFNYEYTHAHDLIKSNWCKENNIPLIRIPYIYFDELCLNDLLLETSRFVENYAD